MPTSDPGRRTGPTRREVTIMGLSLAAGTVTGPAWAQPALPPLIPRSAIFGNPDRTYVELSHDGRSIAWLAPANGVLNVFVAPIADLAAARAVTNATNRPIYGYFWAYDNRTIVFADDADGDENVRVFAVDTATLAKRDLTPLKGVRCLSDAPSSCACTPLSGVKSRLASVAVSTANTLTFSSPFASSANTMVRLS